MFQVKNIIEGNGGNNYLLGNNTPQFEYVNGQLVLSPADDAIYGFGGNDTLLGRGGDDDLYGGSGNDLLNGGSGDDLLNGGSGDDTLIGANASVLSGDGDIDVLTSGSTLDRDLFVLGDGNSVFYNGAGLDYAHITDFDPIGAFHDSIQLTGSSGDYTLNNGSIDSINGALIRSGGETIAVLEGIDANSISLDDGDLFTYL